MCTMQCFLCEGKSCQRFAPLSLLIALIAVTRPPPHHRETSGIKQQKLHAGFVHLIHSWRATGFAAYDPGKEKALCVFRVGWPRTLALVRGGRIAVEDRGEASSSSG